ncbi:hypothetical protein E2320_005607 [Naja naja]|nr:hypothetical protein E2320_005607 [Naja naja]
MAENVVESDLPSAKRPKLSSPALSVSANDSTGGPNQCLSTQSTAGMMPTVNSPVNQPGMGMNAGINAGMNPGMLPAGNGQGMMQGQVMDGSVGAGRGCSNMSSPNPGMGNAGILMAETSQQGSPQMGGQASPRGPQPGAMNKDADLGIARNNTEDHEHKMEKPGLGMDDGSNNQQAAATQSSKYARLLSIQRCIQSLIHACRCHNPNCSVPSCQNMNRVVQHTKRCKHKTNGRCPVCKQVIALCFYHAKHCQEIRCIVPFCLNIKRKLRQQQLLRLLQQAQMLRRRMKITAGG